MKVVVREYLSGNPVLPKHIDWVATGGAGNVRFAIVSFLTVHVQEEDWDHYVEAHLMLSVSHKRYLTRQVNVGMSMEVLSLDKPPKEHSDMEISGVLLRTVRVAEIARLGALGGIFVLLDRDEPPVSLLQWLGPQPQYAGEAGEVLRSLGPVRSNLELVSLHYHAAQMAGAPPSKAVEKTFGLPPRTAAYWISKAKADGLLDPLEFQLFSPPEKWRNEYRKPYNSQWSDNG